METGVVSCELLRLSFSVCRAALGWVLEWMNGKMDGWMGDRVVRCVEEGGCCCRENGGGRW